MYDIIIVGAGPIGLSVAIAAAKHKLNYLVLEKGILVNSIYNFPTNMTFFSTAPELEIAGIPFTSSHVKPNRADTVKYYRSVADYFALNIRYHTKVNKLKKKDGFFDVHLNNTDILNTTYVVLATGYYDNPNTLGIPGENLPKVSHYFKDAHLYYKKKVVVIGGRNSAIEAALDIFRSGGAVTFIHRGDGFDDSVKYWILPDIENRIALGEIKAHFNSRVTRIDEKTVSISVKNEDEMRIENDAVLALIGFHPDKNLMQAAGVEICEDTLVPKHNKKTLETNVKGLYIAGSLTVGREANRIFIFNGRLHGDVIISDIVSSM
jgi:thioredoxin reductase (NADPH)